MRGEDSSRAEKLDRMGCDKSQQTPPIEMCGYELRHIRAESMPASDKLYRRAARAGGTTINARPFGAFVNRRSFARVPGLEAGTLPPRPGAGGCPDPEQAV